MVSGSRVKAERPKQPPVPPPKEFDPADLPLITAGLQQSNAERLQALAERGISLDPYQVFLTRLETMIDYAFGVDSPRRVGYEFVYGSELASMLDNAEKKVNDPAFQVAAAKQRGSTPSGLVIASRV
jgi:hypothetical protein